MEASWPKGYRVAHRPWLTVLDKMIVQDLFRTLLSVLTVIVVIIVSRKFIRVLDEAIAGQVSSETLLSILGLKTILTAIEFLPVALFMAILMVLGRMYRDQEMAAIASAGGGVATLYRAVYLLVMPLFVLSIGLALWVAPIAEAKVDSLMRYDEESADLRGIAAGKFSEYSQGDLVFYVEKISPDRKMHKVFVQNRQHGSASIINAQAARIKDLADGRYLVFEQGERVQGTPGALNFVLEQFAEYAVRIESKVSVARLNKQALELSQLWYADKKDYLAELQRRLAIPMGALLLSLIAVPLAQISPRGGVYGNILVGFLIYFSYGNLTRVSQSWVSNGTISPTLGATAVDALLVAVALVLLLRSYGWQWLVLKLRGL